MTDHSDPFFQYLGGVAYVGSPGWSESSPKWEELTTSERSNWVHVASRVLAFAKDMKRVSPWIEAFAVPSEFDDVHGFVNVYCYDASRGISGCALVKCGDKTAWVESNRLRQLGSLDLAGMVK